ncbi:MAG: uracil-DNA glycosylase family protein [Anaerolineales bacterium]|nr:uracil-DNA glycosylase family protein [Anaerolineales bacterium]
MTAESGQTRAQALDRLHERMRACRLCLEAGYDIYPRAIFSGGVSARILLIGQAPGITEKQAGRPFNAGSGRRLFKWLEDTGIEEDWFRRTQYMTAVTKCYPGRSKSGGGDRVPSRAEQRLCRPYLDQEIALIDPRLIIPVGRLAIGLFYPANMPLDQIIGAQKHVDGRWISPLPHPSGASRWHQSATNQALIRQAVEWIAEYLSTLSEPA